MRKVIIRFIRDSLYDVPVHLTPGGTRQSFQYGVGSAPGSSPLPLIYYF